MARSSLFRALRRAIRRDRGAEPSGWSRREMLKMLGGLAVLPAVGACGDNSGVIGRKVAIVGGGIAGLTAAHFLALAGVRAEIFESSMRTGGRMYTQRGLAGGQLVELGGELVDSNHIVIPLLVESFGLTLDDLVEDTAGLEQDTFHFNGAVIPHATIVAEFTPVAEKMGMAIAASEGEDDASVAEFERIDAMSIPEWLATEANAAPLIKEILEVAYLEEYGLEVSEQSAWNLLYLIDSETPDPFRVFGDSDERFHIHEGNDALTTAIAESLGEQVRLDHRLARVAADGDEYELEFATSGGTTTVTADHVVYALPFTRLREVDRAQAGFSDEKTEVVEQLGYGTNAKLMMQFSDRHWETLGSGGGVITDVGELQTVWATSRGQAGAQGILTNFVGGARGLAMGDGTPESQAATVLPHIETVFPGITPKYVAGSAIRQHWPTYEHVKGSYGCYRVGQWRFFGTEGVREGNQHFCGEHCSEDFQGYMEGGAETGALVAAEVLDDLEVDHPPQLRTLLAMIAARPRASYHGRYGHRMRLRDIRRR